MTSSGRLRAEVNLVQNGNAINLNLPDIVIAASEGRFAQMDVFDYGAGIQTLTFDTDVTLVILIPPTTNVETIVLRGVAGDTGVNLHPSRPTILSISNDGSFVLSLGGSITGFTVVSI